MGAAHSRAGQHIDSPERPNHFFDLIADRNTMLSAPPSGALSKPCKTVYLLIYWI